MTARAERIRDLLETTFAPIHLDIENESHRHAGPADAETHFRVVLVSDVFDGLRSVARHQRVYQCLQPLFTEGLHALALHTKTPSEWAVNADTPASPNCLGGSKSSQ